MHYCISLFPSVCLCVLLSSLCFLLHSAVITIKLLLSYCVYYLNVKNRKNALHFHTCVLCLNFYNFYHNKGGLIEVVQGKYHLRGITSVSVTASDLRCDPNRAVAFTDVSYFLSWINQTLGVKENDKNKFNSDSSCVKFKMDKLYSGRWDALLTIYLQPNPQQIFTRIRLDIIFSGQIQALYVIQRYFSTSSNLRSSRYQDSIFFFLLFRLIFIRQ